MKKHIFTPMKLHAEMLFSAMSHQLRLRVLMLLQREGELCVCELMHALNVSQPMISRHLAHLREWNIVSDRRQGQWVYYRLHDDLPGWAGDVLTASLAGVSDNAPYARDHVSLASMSNRPGSARCA
jgi:ArsR family transcriptional regulator